MRQKFNQTAKYSKKRGFTILELVIVIVIIAILAAVAIPTFIGVVKTAKVSAKKHTAQNINSILILDEISAGRPMSMHDVTREMINNGFDVDQLISDNGLTLVWNQKDNRIAVIDEELNKVYTYNDEELPEDKTLMWQVVSALPEAINTSIYLCDEFSESDIDVGVGVDVGDNTSVKSITYSDNDEKIKNILIRANSNETVTTINNNSDKIDLLGVADTATLISSDINETNSLFVHETLNELIIDSGNAVVKSKARLETVRILSNSIDNISFAVQQGERVIIGEDFTLVIENGAYVGSIVDVNGNAFDFSDSSDENDAESGGNTGNEGNTDGEGGDAPDPYYDFEIFDTSTLTPEAGKEVYVVELGTCKDKLKSTLSSIGGYVILLKDIADISDLKVGKDTILDLNGYSITNTKTYNTNIIVSEGVDFKIIDTSKDKSGSIVCNMSDHKNIRVSKNATLTVYDGNIKGMNSAICLQAGSTVIIKGGSIENIGNSSPLAILGTSNLYINGGYFSAMNKDMPMIGIGNAVSTTITINGGEFDGPIVRAGFEGNIIDNRTKE